MDPVASLTATMVGQSLGMKDPRREAQAERLKELQEKRAAQAQEFLRIIQVSP